MKKLLCLAVILFAGLSFSHAADIAASLKGDLVHHEGGKVAPSDDTKLAGVKYFAFYYSAHWCPPCRRFTPELVKFYNDFKPKHADFELVFVSSDRSAADMAKYMSETHMPWPALTFDKSQSHAVSKYCGPGIPCLVLVDANGKVLSDSFIKGQYVGPQKVVADIEKLVK